MQVLDYFEMVVPPSMSLYAFRAYVVSGEFLQAPVEPLSEAEVLYRLWKAKRLSDRGDYTTKGEILRDLVAKFPESFVIDSFIDGVIGLTYKPLQFQIHILPKQLPGWALLKRETLAWTQERSDKQQPNAKTAMPVFQSRASRRKQEARKYSGTVPLTKVEQVVEKRNASRDKHIAKVRENLTAASDPVTRNRLERELGKLENKAKRKA